MARGGQGLEAQVRVQDGGGQVVCPDCGAVLAPDAPRCPYCGALNPAGAEKAYLDALDGIRVETGSLADKVKGRFWTNLRGNAGRTLALVVLVAALVTGGFLVAGHLDGGDEQRQLREFQDREAFRAAYFDDFEQLYAAGDYDVLSGYVWGLADEPGFDAVFSWAHMGFLEAHDDWFMLQLSQEDAEAGPRTADDYAWLATTALRLVQLDGDDWYHLPSFTAGEKELFSGYQAYAWEVLESMLQMDRSQVTAFADGVRDNYGYLKRDDMKQALEARLRQLGTL